MTKSALDPCCLIGSVVGEDASLPGSARQPAFVDVGAVPRISRRHTRPVGRLDGWRDRSLVVPVAFNYMAAD